MYQRPKGPELRRTLKIEIFSCEEDISKDILQ